jgi:glycoprotein 6-alpha-L-fucosyltransferase
MLYVINYYKKLEIKGFKGEKAVFVASDDPNALRELSHKYKDFIFKDKSFYFNKSEIDDTKYTANNLLHTIFDIHFLSRSDFLVCTMTSNVRKQFFNSKYF